MNKDELAIEVVCRHLQEYASKIRGIPPLKRESLSTSEFRKATKSSKLITPSDGSVLTKLRHYLPPQRTCGYSYSGVWF